MRPRNNTPVLIAVIALALGGMAILNRVQYENRPRTEAELKEELEAKQEASKPVSTATTSLEVPSGQGEELFALSPEEHFGRAEKEAERTVVLGYQWTPEVQADPQKAAEGLKSFREVLGKMNQTVGSKVHFRLVNVDILREQPSGIWLDGRFLSDLNLATLTTTGSHQTASIMREIQSTLPPTKKTRSVKS